MCSAYLNPKSTARVVNYSKDFNFTFCNSYTYFFHWSVATRNFFLYMIAKRVEKSFLNLSSYSKDFPFFQIFIHFFLLYLSVATRKTVLYQFYIELLPTYKIIITTTLCCVMTVSSKSTNKTPQNNQFSFQCKWVWGIL